MRRLMIFLYNTVLLIFSYRYFFSIGSSSRNNRRRGAEIDRFYGDEQITFEHQHTIYCRLALC